MSDALDIRIKASFKDHRKRKKLAARLGPAGVVALLDLWLTTAETHPTGELAGYTSEDIEIDAGWQGAPGLFAATAEQCGWIDRTEIGFRLHDWAEHQPWIIGAPERSARNRANVMRRWDKHQNATAGTPPAAKQNTTGIQPVYKDGKVVIPPSLPSPSLPSQESSAARAGREFIPAEPGNGPEWYIAQYHALPGCNGAPDAAVLHALNTEPDPAFRAAAWNDFAAAVLGAIEPIKSPVALLRGYMRKARSQQHRAPPQPRVPDPEEEARIAAERERMDRGYL